MRTNSDHDGPSIEPTLALGVAAAITATALAGGGSGRLALGVVVVAIWALLGTLALLDRLDFRLPGRELIVAAGALAALVALSALSVRWGSDDGAAFEVVVRLSGYLGILLLVGLLARPGSHPSWLAGLALGGIAVAVIALASRVFGFGADDEIARELPPAAERLSHPLGYWNALGYLMAMTLPPLAYLAATARTGVARAAVAGSVPVVLVLVLTSSRGALLAAAVGLVALVWMTEQRSRLMLAVAVAVPASALVVGLASVYRKELDPIDRGEGWSLAIGAVTILAAFIAQFAFARLDRARDPAGGRRRPGARGVGALAGIVVAVVALVGPSALIGEFRTASTDGDTSEALLSGSGRLSFWDAAVEAFADDPVRGLGAGGYESYWARNGGLDFAVANAHSLELETLAELGVPGAVALAAFLLAVLAAAWRRARAPAPGQRGAVGAALGIVLAGLVAVSFDWTWQIAAAVMPLLVAVALLAGASMRWEGEPAGARVGPSWIPRGVALGGTLAAIWAGGVLAAAGSELSRSADRFAVGDLAGAAEHARTAAEIEPWSAEPHVQLATIELAAANLEAGRRRAEQAARLAPQDARPWLLLGLLQAYLGHTDAAYAYLRRANALGLDRLPLQLNAP